MVSLALSTTSSTQKDLISCPDTGATAQYSCPTSNGSTTIGTDSTTTESQTINGRRIYLPGDAGIAVTDLSDPGTSYLAVGNRGTNIRFRQGIAGGTYSDGPWVQNNCDWDGTDYICHTGGENITAVQFGSTGGATNTAAMRIVTNNGNATTTGLAVKRSGLNGTSWGMQVKEFV